MHSISKKLTLAAACTLLPLPAFAALDGADTAWVLVSAAFVMLMTPGLAFFYAGMVGAKSAASTLYQNFIALAIVGILWVILGFSLAFSGGNGFIGDLGFLMLNGVGQDPADESATIPYILFMAFQMMFAIITPALMSGAVAERIRFGAWVLFIAIWTLAVYSPVAHWVWSSTGWLFNKGALDFAGGYVVHMTAGFSALVAAIVVGKRKSFGGEHKPYSVGWVLIGTSLLWFGWFGFNAGSALGASGLAAHAFVTTFVAAAAAMLLWTAVDTIKDGKPTTMGGCIGVVAGLVAITPAAGFVSVSSALIIGATAGILCNLISRLVKGKFKVDDTLDVFACHGIGGLIGCIMTGLLATTAVNDGGADGLLLGGSELFSANLAAAFAVAAYSVVATFIILKVVNVITPLRVSDADETAGLDASQHGEVVSHH